MGRRNSLTPCIAMVTWEDAMMQGHWNEGAPDPKHDLIVYTVGFLLHEDRARLVMVQSLTDGSYGNEIQIPKGMIRQLIKVPL